MIDIHNHVLIGVDDGPGNREEAVKLLKQAVNDGITDIIATPHHKTTHYTNPGVTVFQKLDALNTIIEEENLHIKVHPGQEIRVNGDIVRDLSSEDSLTLNRSQYVLVELPFNDLPHYTEKLFFDMQMKGYIPVIAHPERCKPIIQSPGRLYSLIEKGAHAQVTATSVTGDLGENLKETSLRMIENNLVHLVASDAHSAESRPFALKEAYEVIAEELGSDVTVKLKKNAKKLLNGQDLIVGQPSEMESHYTKKRKKKKKRFFGFL